MSETLDLRAVDVRYGDFRAVQSVSFTVASGGIGCLLGPSGCGKTSLLRAIAGFEPVAAGEIVLGGRTISSAAGSLPPEQRRVGMVFQDFALFPHLDVQRNVAFGLDGLSRDTSAQRVADMLELVGLAQRARAWPHELSGGQQQRVALARALAPNPDILLLDEPFSSLDSELREQLAMEVRELLQRSGTTAVLVTHDQHEAFAMADTVTLMHGGRVVQCGTPAELYQQPANSFAARFIGEGAVLELQPDRAGELPHGLGHLAGARAGEPVKMLLRPQAVRYQADSTLHLPVVARSFRGAHVMCRLDLPDGQQLICQAPPDIDARPGDRLPVRVDLRQAVLLRD